MALSLESLLANRRAHKNHLTNQTSRPNNNTPTPSPTAPTQAGKTRNRRKRKSRKADKTTNLDTTSNQTPLSNDELLVLARGLTFCPTSKRINLAELSADINDFTRRTRLKEYFHDHNNSTQPKEHNPFHNKSSWTPPTDLDPVLNTYVDASKHDILTDNRIITSLTT